MAEKNTILDLDAMLDESLDDIPQAPEFVKPPPGEYRIKVKEAKIEEYVAKDDKSSGKKTKRIRIQYTVVSTIALTPEGEAEGRVPDGSMFSETFMGTEEGLSYLKARAAKIMNVSDLEGATLRTIFTGLADAEFDARITNRKTKGDKGEEYINTQITVIPPKA